MAQTDLSRDLRETPVGQLVEGLLEVSPPFDSGDLAMLESVFKRERAVEQAKERSQKQQLASIPDGARIISVQHAGFGHGCASFESLGGCPTG